MWLDKINVHGRVLAAMAEGIVNSYIVLLCMTQGYQESDYCKMGKSQLFVVVPHENTN